VLLLDLISAFCYTMFLLKSLIFYSTDFELVHDSCIITVVIVTMKMFFLLNFKFCLVESLYVF
jgi:hypothetical protein